MPSARIVPSFDELEDGHAGLGVRAQAYPVDELALERGKEALAHGIVVAIANRSHGGPDAGLAASFAEGE